MLNRALDRIDEGIMVIDTNYRIVFLNEACENILSINREDALGENIDEFFNHPPEHTRGLQHTLEQQKEFTHEVLPYKWGKYNKYLRQRTKLLRKDGEIVGAMTEFSDITEYINRQEQLIELVKDRAVTVIPITKTLGIVPLQPITLVKENIDSDWIIEKLLKQMVTLNLEKLVIDLSAIPLASEAEATYFSQMLKALTLMGVEVVLSGIRPDLARDIINKGYPFKEYPTFAHMSQALKHFHFYSVVASET